MRIDSYKNFNYDKVNGLVIEIQKMLAVLIKNLKNKSSQPLTSNRKPKTLSAGFSIVELLVAMTLFIVIVSVSVSIYLRTLKVQQAALLLIESNDNLALTVEEMTRLIRGGINFQSSNSNTLEFTDALTGVKIQYRLNGDSIEKGTQNGGNNFDFQRITSDAIKISDFKLLLNPSPINPAQFPPRVVISFLVSSKSDILQNVSTRIQTTASSRFFPIP